MKSLHSKAVLGSCITLIAFLGVSGCAHKPRETSGWSTTPASRVHALTSSSNVSVLFTGFELISPKTDVIRLQAHGPIEFERAALTNKDMAIHIRGGGSDRAIDRSECSVWWNGKHVTNSRLTLNTNESGKIYGSWIVEAVVPASTALTNRDNLLTFKIWARLGRMHDEEFLTVDSVDVAR